MVDWKEKDKPAYRSAIHIWTKTDVDKRECARVNNLNWIEFFDLNQFEDWLKGV